MALSTVVQVTFMLNISYPFSLALLTVTFCKHRPTVFCTRETEARTVLCSPSAFSKPVQPVSIRVSLRAGHCQQLGAGAQGKEVHPAAMSPGAVSMGAESHPSEEGRLACVWAK